MPEEAEVHRVLGRQGVHVTKLLRTADALGDERSMVVARKEWSRMQELPVFDDPVPISTLEEDDLVVRTHLLVSIKDGEENWEHKARFVGLGDVYYNLLQN